MINIYEKYGYYKEGQVSITLEGSKGAEQIKQMMNNLRNSELVKIGKYRVIQAKDMQKDKDNTGLPKSNVLYYELEEDSWCCVRPSGTEPKIKLYFGVKSNNFENAEKDLEELKQAMTQIVK